MAFYLKSLFGDSVKKKKDESVPEVNTETKKCMHCLRRVSVEYDRCPYCKTSEFNY